MVVTRVYLRLVQLQGWLYPAQSLVQSVLCNVCNYTATDWGGRWMRRKVKIGWLVKQDSDKASQQSLYIPAL